MWHSIGGTWPLLLSCASSVSSASGSPAAVSPREEQQKSGPGLGQPAS
uniref:Uncharacterized protein n=1 Tax=Anguilla anguilla TaxID=7936 RepID=A0A0E9WQR4_ANGAN